MGPETLCVCGVHLWCMCCVFGMFLWFAYSVLCVCGVHVMCVWRMHVQGGWCPLGCLVCTWSPR